ncbi:Uncharacterised protein [uncultured archaeon]|nr:Uncharacterised protein [uncultured archaeon]
MAYNTTRVPGTDILALNTTIKSAFYSEIKINDLSTKVCVEGFRSFDNVITLGTRETRDFVGCDSPESLMNTPVIAYYKNGKLIGLQRRTEVDHTGFLRANKLI